MEERPVRPIQRPTRPHPLQAPIMRFNRRNRVPPSFHIPLLIQHRRLTSRGRNVERNAKTLLLLRPHIPESVRHERALCPPVGDVGKVPLYHFGVGVSRELVARVDEGLDGGCVDEVDGGEVEDYGAEDGPRVGLVGLFAAARAGVIPWSVLERVSDSDNRMGVVIRGLYLRPSSRTYWSPSAASAGVPGTTGCRSEGPS